MNDVWWGYHHEHGWVVLDRGIEQNKPGTTSELLFFRCRDEQIYEDRYENWRAAAPAYIYAPKYIDARPDSLRHSAEAELKQHQAMWPRFQALIRAELERRALVAEEQRRAREEERAQRRRQEFERARERFFEQLQRENPGTHKAGAQMRHRVTHCWSCKHHLDNSMDEECNSCGWIVCLCGACGCGYGDE